MSNYKNVCLVFALLLIFSSLFGEETWFPLHSQTEGEPPDFTVVSHGENGTEIAVLLSVKREND